MGWLEDLKRAVKGAVSGNVNDYLRGSAGVAGTVLGLPEFHVSEARAADLPAGYSAPSPQVQGVTDNAYPTSANMGGSGGGGGGGGTDPNLAKTDPPPGASGDELRLYQENEERKAQARRNAIISRLNMMKDEANRLKGVAAEKYDFVKGEVGKNYDALKGIASEKLTNSLEGLTQEGVGIQNTYGKLAGNVRRAMDSALMRNRMLHRAQGSLGSSFYNDAQANTTNQGMVGVDDASAEEADKMVALKGRTSDTNTFFQQKGLEIETEKTNLLQQALAEKNEADASAELMQKQYGIDSEEQLQQNEYEFSSALNSIRDYVQNKAQKLAEIAAYNKTNGAAGSAVGSFAWRDPTTTAALNKNTGQTTAMDKIATLNAPTQVAAASPGASMTGTDIYGSTNKLSKLKALIDPNQYYINSPWNTG